MIRTRQKEANYIILRGEKRKYLQNLAKEAEYDYIRHNPHGTYTGK